LKRAVASERRIFKKLMGAKLSAAEEIIFSVV